MKVEVEFDNGSVIDIEDISYVDLTNRLSQFYYEGCVNEKTKEVLNSNEIKRIIIDF